MHIQSIYKFEVIMSKNPMNVLQFIVPVGFYGAERWILALVNNSDSEKVLHDLVVTSESSNQDLKIIQEYPTGHGETHVINMKSRVDIAVIAQLCNIINDRKIDVIHTHGYKSDILGLIAAKKTGIKCISTPHGFGQPNDFKLKMFIKLGLFCLKFFNKVVPLSIQLKNECLAVGVPEKKISYIQNGVDLTEVEQYRKTKQPKKTTDKKTIGFIGQMIPRKNIKDLLDIFEAIYHQVPNIELQILGDGESRKEMETYAKTLASFDDIRFLGFRYDRMEYLKQFDIFAMTSEDEGIPRCLMEAMGMELAVAAYDIPGIDQLVTHNETGLLANFGDKDTLTRYWVELLTDDDKSRHLASNAKEFVDENFSGQRMAREYLALYDQLVHQ
jgi:glycosyltransferase involved in cell wall biosynthesis